VLAPLGEDLGVQIGGDVALHAANEVGVNVDGANVGHEDRDTHRLGRLAPA
jgi:hypothetical protein